jgi:hypothetical protein
VKYCGKTSLNNEYALKKKKARKIKQDLSGRGWRVNGQGEAE